MKACLTIIATCCFASAAWSQVAALHPTPPATQPAPTEGPKLVRMTVTGQPAPDPALRYHLLPPLTDRTAGNAVLMYYLAQQVMPGRQDPERVQKQRDQLTKYLEMPLTELPQQEVAAFLGDYSTALRQTEIGATREDADWGLPLSEGLTMILPYLGDFRDMAKVLALKARWEIAEGRFDQAIHTIQIGMSMGRHMSGKTVLIGSLVGIAIDSLMLERVRELIDSGGPNLYWALAGLKVPLVDVHEALGYERQWLMMSHPAFGKALAGPIGPAEGAAMLQTITGLYSMAVAAGESGPGLGVLGQAALASRYYGVGKRALIERGRSPEEVEAMPVGQVVAIYLWEDYAHWRDELFKWFDLPYPQAREGLKRSQQQFREWSRTKGRYNPLTTLLPSLGRAYLLQAKLDRTKAALQAIEAIRAHAARHGSPPGTLDQLELPAPPDPVTGKPFEYGAQGDTFTLAGPAPEGEAAEEGVRYEVRVRPAAAPAPAAVPAVAPAALPAAGDWRGIEPFVQDDTIAVAHLDLAALTSDAAWRQIAAVVQEAKLGEDVLPVLAQVRGMGRQYVEAGAAEAFVVVNITDLPEAPMIVVPLNKGADAEKLAGMLPTPGHRACRRVGGALVVATEGQLQLLAEAGAAKRARLMQATALSRGAVRLAFAYSDSIRRALEETIGILPPELGSLPGATLARGLQWASLDLAVQPEVTLRLAIQSADATSAQSMSRLIDLAMKAAADRIRGKDSDPEGAEILESIIKALRPTVDGDRLVLNLDQPKIVSLLRDSVGPAIRKARSQARRAASGHNIRAIVTACHQWAADHQGMFPPNLQALVKAKTLPQEILVNPSRPDLGPAGYVYLRPSVPLSKLESPDTRVVLYEAHERFGEGINVGFADGHAEWIADQARFRTLLGGSTPDGPAGQPTAQPTSP